MKLSDYIEFHNNYIKFRVADKDQLKMKQYISKQIEFIKETRVKQFIQKEVFESIN